MQWNAEVKKLLEKQMWYLATQGERPNVVPVAVKGIGPEGEFLVGDVFLHTTPENLQKNAKIAVSVRTNRRSRAIGSREQPAM